MKKMQMKVKVRVYYGLESHYCTFFQKIHFSKNRVSALVRSFVNEIARGFREHEA